MFLKAMILILISLTSNANEYSGFEIDNKETNKKYNIDLLSGKKDSLRFYKGTLTRIVDRPIDQVIKSITNFEEKCNNDYKDRRELTNKNTDCKYHNSNLVESKKYKNIKKISKDKDEIERYLIARRIYNRQSFSHMDLVIIYQSINENGERVVKINQKMIDDKDVKKYIKPPVEHDSVFKVAYSNFTLTEIEKGKTRLEYYYASETDHWLLNKTVSVSKVFNSMAKSIDLLFVSIDQELAKHSSSKEKISKKIVSK